MSNVNEKNLVLTRAQGAVIARDFPTAARLYKQLLKDDPSNVDYLREIGAIYVKAGEDEKAIPYYEQIITFYPHYIDAMNSLGAIFRRLKRYEESVEILQRAQDEGRQTHDVNYNLGFTYKEMGNYDDAIDAFEMVIGENPSDVLAHNHLGSIYLIKKQYQKSIAAFKRGLQIDQNHPILNYNLANCYREAKQYQDAIRCYEAALRVKPGWIDAIKDYSDLLVKCQKTKEASELVKHSIELHPNDSKLLSILGKIYLEQYDFDAAAKTFKRANSVDGQNVSILSGLAEALEKNEKPFEALDAVCKALEIAPEDKNVKKQYVHTLLSAEEFDSAQVNVQDLYNDNGQSDPQVLDLYGQYCICVDDEVTAGEYFNKIGEVNRQYKEHLLSAASRYAQKGNFNQAERFAKDYVAKNVNNPAGYNMLGSIYSKEGNVEAAIETFNKSQTLKKPNVQAEKQVQMLQNKLNAKPEEVVQPEMPSVDFSDKEEVVIPEVVPEEVKDEGFDFGSMGDNVPMGEALLEEENDFFDDLDKELEDDNLDEPFDTGLENKTDDAELDLDSDADSSKSSDNPFSNTSNPDKTAHDDFDDNGLGDSSNPDFRKNPFDFDDSEDINPFQDFEQNEPKSQAEQLVPDADFSDDDIFAQDDLSDELNPFDIASSADGDTLDKEPVSDNSSFIPPDNSLGNTSGNGNQMASGSNGNNKAGSDEPSYSDSINPDSSGIGDGITGDTTGDSSIGDDDFDFGQFGDSDLDTGYVPPADTGYNPSAGNMEPFANPYGNENPAVNPSVKSEPDSTVGDMGDPYVPPAEDFNANKLSNNQDKGNPYNPYSSYEPDYSAQNNFAREMERKAQEVARESARYAMDAAMDAQKLAQQLSFQQEQLKEKLDSLDNAFNTEMQNIKNPLVSAPENESVNENTVIQPELSPEEATEIYDSGFGNPELDLDSSLNDFENDISPEAEAAFAYDDEMDMEFGDDEDSVLVQQDSLDGDEAAVQQVMSDPSQMYIPAEEESIEASEEDVSEDIPEIDATDQAETANASSLIQPMLDTNIEALENSTEEVSEEIPDTVSEEEVVEEENEPSGSSELELFKKLRSLCDFVPDSERQSNNYDNMRTRIEYIISKMSGKQGLLKVAEGYAPEDASNLCFEECDTLDQDLIVHVLTTMKNLAASLEDQSVAVTLCSKADSLMEKLDV